MRKEICEIYDGKSVFDIHGSGENILYYNQKPYAYEWSDNSGSIGKYLARSKAPIAIKKSLEQIRYYAENGMHDDVKLAYAIDPLLKLLSNGTYELIYPFKSFECGLDLIEFENRKLINFYPTALTLICLQPLKSNDVTRIEYFKEKIKTGKRPVIFVLGLYEAGDKYILDGHHKAYAYRSLNVEANILFIRKTNNISDLSENRKKDALYHFFPDVKVIKDKHPLIN